MRFLVVALSLSLSSPVWAEEPAPSAPNAAVAVAPVEIVVEAGRYEPATVTVKAGEPVRLRFLRKEWNSCTAQVVFPTLGITVDLPPNVPVDVELPPLPAGETPFRCAMLMVHGTIVVEAK